MKNHNEKKFVPGGRASHKVPKDAHSGVQGTTRDIKKDRLDRTSIRKGRGAKTTTSTSIQGNNTNTRGRGKRNVGDVVPREPRSNPDQPGRGTNPKYATAATNPRRTALNDPYDDPTQWPEYGESYKDRIIPDEDY